MTPREPSFDELVGGEPTGTERERLRRTHELLLQAGAPPELPPELEAGPQLKRVQTLRRRRVKRRSMLLLAATLAVVAVFFVGYAVGNRGGGTGAGANAVVQLALKGTSDAPKARATLTVLQRHAGNWPMTLTVEGLPRSPAHSEYAVYLIKDGEHYPCGTFVSSGQAKPLTVSLNAPYRLRRGDTWVVTEHALLSHSLGPTVLRPA